MSSSAYRRIVGALVVISAGTDDVNVREVGMSRLELLNDVRELGDGVLHAHV